MTEGTDLTQGEVNEEFAKDLAAVIKSDNIGKSIMHKIIREINDGGSFDNIKIRKKFEVRMAILDRKPKADLPFSINWC